MYIRGAFHNNFPGFSGFGFRRKLARTKTQQGTYKASEYNRHTLFFALFDLSHSSTEVASSFFYPFYPLFVLLPHNLHQLLFSPLPPPPLEHAIAIIDRVSVPPGGNRRHHRRRSHCCHRRRCQSCTRDAFSVGHSLAGDRRQSRCSGPTLAVPLEVGHRRKFLIPPHYTFFVTSYHLRFLLI